MTIGKIKGVVTIYIRNMNLYWYGKMWHSYTNSKYMYIAKELQGTHFNHTNEKGGKGKTVTCCQFTLCEIYLIIIKMETDADTKQMKNQLHKKVLRKPYYLK